MENLRNKSVFLEVLLRVPPIIAMDILCLSDYIITINGWEIVMCILRLLMTYPLERLLGSFPAFPALETFIYYFIYNLGLVASIALFLQKTQHLMSFYFILAAIGVVVWSYILNEEFVKFCTELFNVQHTNLLLEIFHLNTKALQVFTFNYVYQTFLAIVFSFTTMSLPKFPQNRFLIGVLFIVPMIVAAPFPSISPFPFVVSILPISIAVITVLDLLRYCSKFISNLPLFLSNYFVNACVMFFQSFDIVYYINYLKTTWKNYHVTAALQVFGVIRLLKNLVLIVYDDGFFTENLEIDTLTLVITQIQYILQELVVRSCDNIVAILSVASVTLYFIDNCIWKPVQKLLLVPDNEKKSIFTFMSLVVIILSLISGITNLKPSERLTVLGGICILIRTVFSYEIHGIVCKRLDVLSKTGNTSLNKHCRVLFCCIVILSICIFDFILYFNKYDTNHWIIRSGILSIEIAVTLVVSLIIYALNMVNLHIDSPWHELYDYIYYLESINSSFSLIIGFLMFVRGIMSLLQTGSLLKVIFLVLHLYYNVCIQLIQGWHIWKMRRYVAKCVEALPRISEREYAEVDVCAICYENIGSHAVSMTRCNHFYHKSCLKRWLYNRRTCPMCHRMVIRNQEYSQRDRVRN